MAFANSMRHGDERKAATSKVPVDKSRSFSAFAQNSTPEGKSNSLSINYGNGTSDWGPNSIWSHGSLGTSLTSRATTRDNSRDASSHVGQEEQAKGVRSGASLSIDDPWRREWKPSADRTMSQAEYGNGNALSQQRGARNANTPAFSNPAVGSRPPTISLNTTSIGAASGPRSGGLPNTATTRGYEPAPTVYTKHDRQQEPGFRSYRDSATAGSWTNTSPTDTRRPFLPSSRTVSQPMSRSGSQQHATSGDEQPVFSRPDYGRGQRRSTQNSSRAPSLSSNGMHYHSFADPHSDHLPMQFGQLSMNGDSRPQTSYRSQEGSFSHPWSAGVSPLTRTSMSDPRASFGATEDIDDSESEIQRYNGFPDSLSPLSTNFAAQAYEGRFPPTPTTDFRPGQNFTNGHVSAYGLGMQSELKNAQDWQSLSNGMGPMQLSRRSSSAAHQQAYMTPQMQQLFAAQLRQHYGPMFNPYAMPNPMHLNGFNPYLSMMPMSFPTVDPNTAVQQIEAGENIQSALLFEFKNQNKSKRYELRDIYEHIAEFSGDQHGSRFIQTKLETANADEKSKVFEEIAPNAIQLMTDVFGNYVIQKFFEHGDQMHKKILAAKMKGQVLQLTNQMYGCRVVQKALDHVLVDQQLQLIRELEGYVLRCVKDQNGNHVIQKAIERCPASIIGFIVSAFQGSVQQLSVNSYGCRVIQRCLEYCDKPAKAMIMGELMDAGGLQGMITDQYGNYVVQHVVEKDEGDGRRCVLGIVMKSLELYSKHKFASNVVEKCLEFADEGWRRGVVGQLANGGEERRVGGGEGESVLVGMIKDSYGNYVIQKLLDTINPAEYFLFLDTLQPAVTQAKRTGCGKQIQSVERKMERFSRAGHTTRHTLPPCHNTLPSSHGFHPPTGPGAPAFNSAPSYQFGLPAPLPQHFVGTFGSSTGTTPPPLTAGQSGRSSGMQSLNGDAVEGAHQAHALGQGVVEGYMR